MKIKLIIPLLLILLTHQACKNKISIEGLDLNKWKSDKGGCSGERGLVKNDFIAIKNKLKGHNSSEIIEFLGKPDKEDLYTRNQKIFYYYLASGKHCEDWRVVSNAERIIIRFSAMDRVTEVTYFSK